jgi:hypothetical protein
MRDYPKSGRRYEDGGDIVPSNQPYDNPFTIEGQNTLPSDKEMGAAKRDLTTLLKARAKSQSNK